MKEIKLTRNKIAFIDDEDFMRVSKYKWHFLNTGYGYAKTTIYIDVKHSKEITMHRFIMNFPKGKEIDHINGNGLDNRKSNLRICTRLENILNRKISKNKKIKFKGVSFNPYGKRIKRYKARVALNGRVYHLGYFLTPEEASIAYFVAAKKLHGDFCYREPVTVAEPLTMDHNAKMEMLKRFKEELLKKGILKKT